MPFYSCDQMSAVIKEEMISFFPLRRRKLRDGSDARVKYESLIEQPVEEAAGL